jgi:hypothetical protein
MGFKHLVILGAGSTIATIPPPRGDKNGMCAYTLNNFLSDPFFADFLSTLDRIYRNLNVEELCEKMYSEDEVLYHKFEALIRKKYSLLELPDSFSILERLIMSLNADDAILSFNWDDLIIQAYNRAQEYIPSVLLPKIGFPHGNAQACYNKNRYGSKRNPNNQNLFDSPLNMPINELTYKDDLFIKSQWKLLDFYIRNCQMITFFGYRGPVSDKDDLNHMVDILKKNQICGKIEIIDKTKEEAFEVAKNLQSLVRITESKADCCGDFYESRIAQYPRRTLKSLDNYNYHPTIVPKMNRRDFLNKIRTLIEEEQTAIEHHAISTCSVKNINS